MFKTFTLFTLFAFLSIVSFCQPGTPLPTFGSGGLVTNPQFTNTIVSIPPGLLVEPGPKLLARGTFDGDYLRYDLRGQLLETIVLPTDFQTIQPDGKMLFANTQVDTLRIRRTSSDLTPDPSFGNQGVSEITITGGQSKTLFLVGLQPDGKILCVGTYYDTDDPSFISTNNYSLFFVRFNSNGSLDGSFGSEGIIRHASSMQSPRELAFLPDNKFILASQYQGKTGPAYAYYRRYNSDGSTAQSTFFYGHDMNRTVNFFKVAVQPDGKFIINTASYDSSLGVSAAYNFMRFNQDGMIDNFFGVNGVITTKFKPNVALAVQTSGKVLVVGTDSIARFNADGSRDQSFGYGGSLKVQNNALLKNFVYNQATLLEDTLYLKGLQTGSPNIFALAALQLGGTAASNCLITGGNEVICQGTTTTWSGPEGMDTYQWSGPGGFVASTKNIIVSVPGIYILNSSQNGINYTCGRTLVVNLLPTVTITASGNASGGGLSYQYYEGSWSQLPDFGGLRAVASGNVSNVTLSPRKRDEQFAFLFQGKINIPKAGRYYFETRSDDGSKLYIGNYGHYVTPVVDNDGQHGAETRGGWYTFPSAGQYDFAVSFFEQGGAEVLNVYWGSEDAGIAMHTRIPDEAFVPQVSVMPSLTYKYYEGSWTSLPDFGGLTPVASGTTNKVDISPKRRDASFAFLWEGTITIPKAGRYYFETASDDGSRFYIGGYGHYVTPVVDNDGQHAMQFRGGWYSFPAAGSYPIAITFFEAGGSEGIEVYWTAPEAGIPSRTLVPSTAFEQTSGGCSPAGVTLTASEGDSYLWSTGETTRSVLVTQPGSYTVTVIKDGCSATSEPMIVSCIDNSITQTSSRANKGSIALQGLSTTERLSARVLPNPSPSHFSLQVSSQSRERITVQILDAMGRLIETKIITAGSVLQVGSTYRPGTYFAQVVQAGEKLTLKLVKTAAF